MLCTQKAKIAQEFKDSYMLSNIPAKDDCHTVPGSRERGREKDKEGNREGVGNINLANITHSIMHLTNQIPNSSIGIIV